MAHFAESAYSLQYRVTSVTRVTGQCGKTVTGAWNRTLSTSVLSSAHLSETSEEMVCCGFCNLAHVLLCRLMD